MRLETAHLPARKSNLTDLRGRLFLKTLLGAKPSIFKADIAGGLCPAKVLTTLLKGPCNRWKLAEGLNRWESK